MRTFKRALIAGAVALAVSAPAAAQFSNGYFFGDSLTDAGSYKPVLPPGTGLFTTNPGPIWAQAFAQHYGFTASPANQGGNDYAYGGARVTELPGYPAMAPTAAAVPIATQISQFLAKGPADPNAIYSVWGGANDLFTQLTLLQSGTITQADVQANLALAATQLAQQVGILHAGGAQYIIVWNLPDIGKTPFGIGSGQSAQITALSSFYNSILTSGLNAVNVPTIRLNVFGLLNEIIANPAAYGFVNATTPACGAVSSLVCVSANLVAPNAAQTYVFADAVHPTTGGHAILAQYAESVIAAPQQMAVLGEMPLAVEQANWRTLDGRMIAGLGAPRSQGKLEAWAAYDYGSPDYSSSFFNGDGAVNTVSVGGDMKLSDRLLMGVQFGYSENKTDYSTTSVKLREPMGTLYLGYGEGPWYVGGTVGAGGLSYDTKRNITLGATTRTESGSANGWQFVGRRTGGYWFRYGDWVHGPNVKLTYQEIRVHEFEENGADSTTMFFNQQQRDSFITSLGWQASGQIGAIRPFGRVSWEYEGQADNRSVTAGVFGMGGSFSMPAYKPDNNWALFNLGAATDFGKVTGYLTATATAGKSDGDYWAVTLGVKVPL